MELTLDSDLRANCNRERGDSRRPSDAEWSRLATRMARYRHPRMHGGAVPVAAHAVIFEELGRGAMSGPIFSSAVLPPTCSAVAPGVGRRDVAVDRRRHAASPSRRLIVADGHRPGGPMRRRVSGTVGRAGPHDRAPTTSSSPIPTARSVDAARLSDRPLSRLRARALTADFDAAARRTQAIDAPCARGHVRARRSCAPSGRVARRVRDECGVQRRAGAFGKAIAHVSTSADHIIAPSNVPKARVGHELRGVAHRCRRRPAHDNRHRGTRREVGHRTSHVDACTSAHEVHAGAVSICSTRCRDIARVAFVVFLPRRSSWQTAAASPSNSTYCHDRRPPSRPTRRRRAVVGAQPPRAQERADAGADRDARAALEGAGDDVRAVVISATAPRVVGLRLERPGHSRRTTVRRGAPRSRSRRRALDKR